MYKCKLVINWIDLDNEETQSQLKGQRHQKTPQDKFIWTGIKIINIKLKVKVIWFDKTCFLTHKMHLNSQRWKDGGGGGGGFLYKK